MEAFTDTLCWVCKKPYSASNPPRKLPCLHVLCTSCVALQVRSQLTRLPPYFFQCPFDQRQILMRHNDIHEFPIDKYFVGAAYREKKESTPTTSRTSIIEREKISSNKETMFQRCEPHGKSKDFLCNIDKEQVCSDCGVLYHKDHDLTSYAQLQGQKKRLCAQIIQILAEINSLKLKLNNDECPDIRSKMASEKQRLVSQVRSEFSKLYKLLAQAEEECIANIQGYALNMEKEAIRQLHMPPIMTEAYRLWEQTARRHLAQSEQQNDKDLLQNKKVAEAQGSLILEGRDIINRMERIYLDTIRSTFKSAKELKVQLDWNLAERIIALPKKIIIISPVQQIGQIRKQVQVQPSAQAPAIKPLIKSHSECLVTQIDSEEEMLLQSAQTAAVQPQIIKKVQKPEKKQQQPSSTTKEKTVRSREKSQSINSVKSMISSRSSKRISAFTMTSSRFADSKKKPDNSMLDNKSQSSINSFNTSRPRASVLNPLSPNTSFNKKGLQVLPLNIKQLKIGLPQKYYVMIEDIMTEKIDMLDLTRCDMEISQIIHLVEMLNCKQSIKTMKMIKCGITDQAFEKMLPNWGHVVTLNLSQNYLSDKIFEMLDSHSARVPNLRKMILNQNTIKERNMRQYSELLTRLNIEVVV